MVMLRDYNISGRINLMEIPVLLHMLHFWKVRGGGIKRGKMSWAIILSSSLFVLMCSRHET